MTEKLSGKTALITGGNSGIGLAIAQEFSSQGANIAIFGRDEASLKQTAETLPGQAIWGQGDVRDVAGLEKFIAQAKAHFGAIDIVVANAGGATIQPFLDVDEDSFDVQSDINFKGAFFTVQKAVPHMPDGGVIVMTSSSANCRAVPGMSVYGAAKAALRSLGRTLAQELAPRNIRINVLTPGPVLTPAYERTGLSQEEITQFQADQAQQIPLGHIGQPEELAKAALFLASSDSSYVTGAELVVDGGLTQI